MSSGTATDPEKEEAVRLQATFMNVKDVYSFLFYYIRLIQGFSDVDHPLSSVPTSQFL